ncbi:LAGLIDADG family homing endonuclease [Methylobacterium nodulans]|uniref:Homing endonuclease LAGLIDADG domain-containing protein n=1 Tax=Methylobacterium nodulans (strain LMG 21967 / CNCM I-2342 / ORS 2060) TaxID=460265 RepID=B8IAJ7_METNO|nr:LAGLIDADG family homing endonuclease [Methylobacterium nodulans]ACL61042.1 hypothetical protein Mnod_6236 [Methylobacterium nodulans ORS 2060]
MTRRSGETYDQIAGLDIATTAYLAGLIDADGTISVSPGKTGKDGQPHLPTPIVLIVNGDLELIRWLKEVIGYGCSYETKTRPKRPDQSDSNWNKVHRYQLGGRAAIAFLAKCRPYLREKRRQADLVLSMPSKGKAFAVVATVEQRARAFEAMEKIRALNRRGLKPDPIPEAA